MLLYLLFIFILMLFSMFCSGSETAVYAYDSVQAADLARKGTGPLSTIYRRLGVFLPTILLMNFFANTGMTVIATVLTVEHFGGEKYLPLTGFILTVVILVFAEITPKIIAIRYNYRIARIAAWPIVGLMIAFRPVTSVLTWGCRSIQNLLPWKPLPVFTSAELKTVVKEAMNREILEPREAKILQNIVTFRQKAVKEFMIPRIEICYLPIDTSPSEVRRKTNLAGHTRFPVTKNDDIDSTIGCVHVKEVLLGEKNNLEEALRPVYFAPENMFAGRLFHTLRENRIQQAIIVDEYGQVAGLVTVHDLIEELMGDIRDEYSPESSWIVRKKGNGWIINATEQISVINNELQIDLPVDQGRTLGGFLFNIAGHLPKQQEKLSWGDWEFTVQVVSRKRITEVLLIRRDDQ